jgi:hypothetical protein
LAPFTGYPTFFLTCKCGYLIMNWSFLNVFITFRSYINERYWLYLLFIPRVVHIWLELSNLVKVTSLSNPLEICSNHFPSWLSRQGCINKDPTLWLDWARPSPNDVLKNNMSSMNSKFDQLRPNNSTQVIELIWVKSWIVWT